MGVETEISADALLASVGRGDRQAFRRLYYTTSPKLYGICLGMLREREHADEAFQDAFVRIWERAAQYDPKKGAAIVWMATVTRRCVIDRMRFRVTSTLSLDDIDPDGALLAAAPLASAGGANRDLKRCLERLKQDQAKTILLVFVYGLTHEELATTMSRSLGTVKSWIRRGLADLKNCMSE